MADLLPALPDVVAGVPPATHLPESAALEGSVGSNRAKAAAGAATMAAVHSMRLLVQPLRACYGVFGGRFGAGSVVRHGCEQAYPDARDRTRTSYTPRHGLTSGGAIEAAPVGCFALRRQIC